MQRIRFWLYNARPVSLPQSLMPAVTALFLSAVADGFCWWLGALAVLGGCLAHLGMNLADDYYDFKMMQTGIRDSLAREGIRARTEKCPYLVNGEVTPAQTFRAILVFGILALIPGVIVIAFRGWPVLLIVVIAIFLGESYSGNPLRLSYRGLGEADIGLMFGPLLMAGVYYAAAGQLSLQLLIPAICMGLLVTNILYVHSVLDIEADRKADKKTLAIALKNDQARMIALAILLFVPYGLTIAAVIGRGLHPAYILSVITLPWAFRLFRSVRAHISDPLAPVTVRGYNGPMANWDTICAAGLDWFMFRWYLARNLMTAFALIYIAVSVGLSVTGNAG